MKICDCGNYVEGATDKCATCNRADRKAQAAANKPRPAIKYIKPVSKARGAALDIYYPIRDAFLAKHKICQCCGAAPATEVHHKAGRVGKMLYNIKYFLATCNGCHREIEANPAWAIANGYSSPRLISKKK